MAAKYAYSNELKANAVGTDYDMCELALSGKMGMTAKILKFQTDGFRPKRAEKQVGTSRTVKVRSTVQTPASS